MICPRCNSENIIKNGNTIYDKPEFMCKDCQKHFVRNPLIRKIPDEKKLADKLLLEKIPLRTLSCYRQNISEKQIISNILIILCIREFHSLSEKLFFSRKNLRITQVQYHYLFIIIIV